MNYREFTKRLADMHPGMLRTDAKKIANITFDAISRILLSGDSVIIPGVCTLIPHYKRQGGRVWTSPHDGQKRELTDKVQLHIRPHRSFIAKITEKLLSEDDNATNSQS